MNDAGNPPQPPAATQPPEDTGDEDTGDEDTGDEETGDEETGDEETGDTEHTEDTGALTIPAPDPDYTAAGVPTLDYVRDRIEGRYANALGATELADESEKGREIAEQLKERDEAAKDRLEQIRKSLHPGTE